MKAKFEVFEMEGYFEMNKENLNRAEALCDKNSEEYFNYILSVGWDDKNNEIYVIADGPWEC